MAFLNKSKIGAQGIGTLIIFIALILVAAVAAGVLIQTSGSLQSEALDVGRVSQDRIVAGLDVLEVSASDASDGIIEFDNDQINVIVKLNLGSRPVKLADIGLLFNSKSTAQPLSHAALPSTSEFTATYLTNGGAAQTSGYLTDGELVELQFLAPVNITETDSFSVGIITADSQLEMVDLTTPSAMVINRVTLYP